MANNHTQTLQKVTNTETTLFLISYILFSTSKNDFLPNELLPFSGIPLLYNFWLLTKHYKLVRLINAEPHPKKRQLSFRFYLNVFMDVLLMVLIVYEILK